MLLRITVLRVSIMSSIPRSASEPMPTILLTSAKWSETSLPDTSQAVLALVITFKKFRHWVYSSSCWSSRASQYSTPSSVRWAWASKVEVRVWLVM